MSLETYRRALNVSTELGDPMVLISGGEPTEHPQILELITEARRMAQIVGVLSNGMFLANPKRAGPLLATGASWQITNDPRFYPHRIPRVEHPALTYIDRVTVLERLGRWTGETTRAAPNCFNLRSATRHFRSFALAVGFLRWQSNKFCTPSIDVEGTIRAGESTECYPIGTIWSTEVELTEATLAHDCDLCGLHKGLSPDQRKAVGYAKTVEA